MSRSDPETAIGIVRIEGNVPTRHWGSAYGDIACVLGMSDDFSLSFEEQAARAFQALDRGLAQIGSSRAWLLSVQVYLHDVVGAKAGFDEMWAAWIGADPAHWPMRSCVQVTFAGGNKIEMIAWAVRRDR